jgi:hypothetical protein
MMVLLSTAAICNNMMMRMMMMMTMISCYYYRYPKLISQIPNWVVLLFFLLFTSPQNTPTPTPKKVSPAETDPPPSGNAKPVKLSITQLSKKITLNHKELLTPQHYLHQ